MAKVAALHVYKFPDQPKYYIKDWLIQAAFKIQENDEWMHSDLYQLLHSFLPKNVGMDDDDVAWYDFAGKKDPDAYNIVFHGFDEDHITDYNEAGLAYVSFFISLKTGRVYKVESESVEP